MPAPANVRISREEEGRYVGSRLGGRAHLYNGVVKEPSNETREDNIRTLSKIATVQVRSAAGGIEEIQADTFARFKRERSGRIGLLLQGDKEILTTRKEIEKLEPGVHEAKLLQRAHRPAGICRKVLRGHEAWEEI